MHAGVQETLTGWLESIKIVRMTSTMSSVAARTSGRSSLPVALRCGCQISTSRHFSSGTKLKSTRSLCRMRPTTQQRQVRPDTQLERPHHTRCDSLSCVWTAQTCFLQVVTMGIFGLGGPEIAVIAGVAVLIFGEHLCSAKAH